MRGTVSQRWPGRPSWPQQRRRCWCCTAGHSYRLRPVALQYITVILCSMEHWQNPQQTAIAALRVHHVVTQPQLMILVCHKYGLGTSRQRRSHLLSARFKSLMLAAVRQDKSNMPLLMLLTLLIG